MNLEQFQTHVNVLVKPASVILQTLNPSKVNLIHAALGLAGEAAELLEATESGSSKTEAQFRINVREELGDVMFYTFQLRDELSQLGYAIPVPMPDQYNFTAADIAPPQIAIMIGDVIDLIKKHAVYDKRLHSMLSYKGESMSLGAALVNATNHLIAALLCIPTEAEIPLEEILQANYDKLKARYPEGYTDQAADTRADKQSGEDPIPVQGNTNVHGIGPDTDPQ